MTRGQFNARARDWLFLIVGGYSFVHNAILTQGPWPTLIVSAGLMLGPTVFQLWLLGPGTPARGGPPPPEPSGPLSSSPLPLVVPPGPGEP